LLKLDLKFGEQYVLSLMGCLDVDLEYRGLNDKLALSLTHIEVSGDRNIRMRLANSLRAECASGMCSFRMFDRLDGAVTEANEMPPY
jgi:hypothetical protein